MFAKLFEHHEHGQILVKLDAGTDDTDVEIRFYVEPPGLGVCSFAYGYGGDDAWDRAESVFAGVDESTAVSAVVAFLKIANPLAPKG